MATEGVEGEQSIPIQKTVTSRGVPAKESIWLDDIRKRRNEWQYHKKVRLELEHIIQIIFPKQYQPKYYDVAFVDAGANSKWYLQNYGGSNTWYVGDIQALEINPVLPPSLSRPQYYYLAWEVWYC